MIARYNKLSFVYGVPGLIAQMVSFGLLSSPGNEGIGNLLLLGGSALLITGFAFYAKAKGRNPAWGVMGLFSWIGLVALALLKDLSPEVKTEAGGAAVPCAGPQREGKKFCAQCRTPATQTAKFCATCGAAL